MGLNDNLQGISEVYGGAIKSPTGFDVVVDERTSFDSVIELSMRDRDGKGGRMTHRLCPLRHVDLCVLDRSKEETSELLPCTALQWRKRTNLGFQTGA